MTVPPPDTAFLRRRNALWQDLRAATPGTPAFERLLTQLSDLIRWDRARILAGLGLPDEPLPPIPEGTAP